MRDFVRTAALLICAATICGCATARFEAPAPPTDASGMNALHEVRTEWLYFSGIVDTAEGRELGVMFTIFQMTDSLTGRHFYPGILVVLDPASRLYYPQVDYGQSKATATHGVPGVRTGAASFAQSPDGSMAIAGTFAANKIPLGIDLALTPTRGALLHGGNGIIRMGDGIDSGYYSFTDLTPRGSVRVGASTYTVVGGRIWMDHQWGNWTDDGTSWDWFSLRFDDGAALMLFQFRDRKNNVVPGNWSYRAADGTLRYGHEYRLAASRHYRDKELKADYPLDWTVTIPDLNASFTVSPVFDEQVVKPSRIWEGLCAFQGHVAGNDARGSAFVELTGY